MQKVTIVGAGRVGEATAQFMAENNMCRELMLMDILEGVPQGVALDIQETAPLLGFDTRVNGCHNPDGLKDSELIVITAGLARKPGMSRSDVLASNVKILDGIVEDIVKYAPDSMILVVSNPVDILTYRAFKKSGFERQRVFGQAGVLDSARMAAFIALETGFSVQDIDAMVLGGHGDQMVPMTRYTTISGIPIANFLDDKTIGEIVDRTRHGGAEILGLRQNSSAYDAPGVSVATMVDSIRHNRRRVMPTVAILEGEYGEDDVAMGVPVILGQGGMERVIELKLNDEERAMFDTSVAAVRKDLETLRQMG
jgi:malate dehydrogenase